jgi:DNA-binding MarR family transcriptional regulator
MSPHPTTSIRRDEAHNLVMLFKAFSLASEHQLSVASVLALVQIAVQTQSPEQPRFATPTDVARALNMSLSAVVRLLAKLAEPGGPEFLVSNRSWWRGRSDAYALTPAGKEFVSNLLASCRNADRDVAPLASIAKFETAKRHPHEPLHKLKQIDWNDEQCELRLDLPDAATIDLVTAWTKENIAENAEIFIAERKDVVIRFKSANDAVWFKLRWC